MSATPTQPDPKEAVEAQLCAYLEGDLSPAERAAIERHLASHPQHQRLLADLGQQRGWLRGLPRASAPPEVGEAFHQQVERVLLLGDDRPKPTLGPLTGRGQQVAIMAALLLMTTGLGLVLALMLSGPSRPVGRIAGALPVPTTRPAGPVSEPVTAAPPPAAVAAAPAAHATSEPTLLAERTPAADQIAAAATPRPAPSPSPSPLGGPTTEPFVPATPPSIASGGFAGFASAVVVPSQDQSQVPPQTVHLIVTTADPSTVSRFLVRSGLTPMMAGQLADAEMSQALSAANNRNGPEPDQQRFDSREHGFGGGGGGGRTEFQPQQPTAARAAKAFAQQHQLPQQRYVASGLTAAQLRQLQTGLAAAAGPGHVVDGPGLPAATVMTSTIVPSAADRPLNRGDTVTVQIPQLTGPGVGQTNVVRVGNDGTIALPMLDNVPAAGATPAEVARRVADRYRAANLIARPQVTVTNNATGPASQQHGAAGATRSIVVDVQTTTGTPGR